MIQDRVCLQGLDWLNSVMSAFSIGHTLSTAIEWAVVQLHEAHM